MNYLDFYQFLSNNKMINPIWENLLELIETEISDKPKKNDILILFCIYFSLIDDGNICMSLDGTTLEQKWQKKISSTQVLLEEKNPERTEEIRQAFDDFNSVSIDVIKSALSELSEANLPEIIGENRMFQIDDNWIYTKKYNTARVGIINKIKNLFAPSFSSSCSVKYEDLLKSGFSLTDKQALAVTKGLNQNLTITGGPGTGKTTSILFILLLLLLDDADREIYLLAPSGKAASRMKESILKNLNNMNEAFKEGHADIVRKLNLLEESTIHRLLAIDSDSGVFTYNKGNPLNKAIYVIDEASMIDVCLFNSLLQAIPDESRVFILGDRNQLPSVDAGAVFGDLLNMVDLKDNIIEIDESVRFKKDSKIYELSNAINQNIALPVSEEDWDSYRNFNVSDDINNIFYFKDSYIDEKGLAVRNKDIIDFIVNKWGTAFYSELQKLSTDLDENDTDYINRLFALTEQAKILSAENEGTRGVKNVNSIIKNSFIDKTLGSSIIGYYPGQVMMITKNNKLLDLYNGDSGILVTFKDDDTLYFMVKKSTKLVLAPGKQVDNIFTLGSFTFYPLRLISQSEIELAYAITIHKSQGSDYQNILVILPKNSGHPLLNRQIVYTAITRTKGNTYILSNQNNLEIAKKNTLERDTNITL